MKRPGESPTKRLAHINDSKKTGRLKKLRAQAKGSCAKKAGQNRCLDKVASGQEARSWPGKTLPVSLAHTQTKISRTTNRSSLPFPFMPEYVHKQYGKARHSIAHLGAPQDRSTTRSIFYHVKWHLSCRNHSGKSKTVDVGMKTDEAGPKMLSSHKEWMPFPILWQDTWRVCRYSAMYMPFCCVGVGDLHGKYTAILLDSP